MVLFTLRLIKLKKISLLLALLPSLALANIALDNTPVPGGVAVVEFSTNHAHPKVTYGEIPIYVQKLTGGRYQALIGIPLMAKPGTKYLNVQDFSKRKVYFEVLPQQYEEQHITLSGSKKKYVEPDPDHIKRITGERQTLGKARTTYSNKALSLGKFKRPVEGITTGSFGLKRFYNNQPRRAHTGVDYAAKLGTPVQAPASGQVILIGEFFFNGKTVFIDHGMGLISVYIHLDKILVEQGQALKQGDVIGHIGQTGRATGPHLHWGIYLNQTAVNPNLFLGE